nr:hypothetical protein KXZ65_09870 [Pectobacterium sp. PL152]
MAAKRRDWLWRTLDWLVGAARGCLDQASERRGDPPGNWVVSQLDKSGAKLVPTLRDAGCDGLPDSLLLASPFISQSEK